MRLPCSDQDSTVALPLSDGVAVGESFALPRIRFPVCKMGIATLSTLQGCWEGGRSYYGNT